MNYPDGCIPWLGKLDRNGYGCVAAAGEKRAHRAIYRMFVGPIPKGMAVLHGCDNPCCVNPLHLSLGTAADNALDRVVRGRHKRGTDSPNAKLNSEAVSAIRGGCDVHTAKRLYGIQKSTYYRVRSGQSYAPAVRGKA